LQNNVTRLAAAALFGYIRDSAVGEEMPRAMRAGEDSQHVTSRLTIPNRSAFILDSSIRSAIFAF
jgi:hypothetical protein